MITYYRHGGGYIAVKDQSPDGFEGLVFVGRGGPIDAIEDQLFPADQLTDPVQVGDVPQEWCQALGYHAVEDFPLLDEAGENLVAEIPVRVPLEDEEFVEPSNQINPYFIVGMVIGAVILAVLWPWL